MAKYQKYAEYKDSGVEWFVELPIDWKVSKLKQVVDQNRQITYGIVQAGPNVENGTPYIRPADMTDEKGIKSFDELLRTSEQIALSYDRSKIKTGDIVISIGPSFGKVMMTPANLDGANLTQGTARIAISSEHNSRYFFWVLRSTISFSQWESVIGGATFRALNLGPLADTYVGFPSYDEQVKIATFLDHETAQIDTLIAKQEKLIELLKEKRQAVISHAVTKGLNPHVTMKDSGVEWLGEVPEHWEIPKLLHITTRIGDGLHSTPLYQEGTGYYFINGNNLVDGKIFIGETAKEVPESEFIKHQVSLDKTTVLLSINGTIGKVAQFNDEPVILGKSASYINCCRELLPNFLMNYLTSSQAKNYYDLEVTGTTIYNLSLNSIRNMKVPLPPIDEQKNIILFIAEQYSKYDRLIQSSEKQNQLLKERRTALISSAVTGKIDVRHHASRPSGNDKKQTEGI